MENLFLGTLTARLTHNVLVASPINLIVLIQILQDSISVLLIEDKPNQTSRIMHYHLLSITTSCFLAGSHHLIFMLAFHELGDGAEQPRSLPLSFHGLDWSPCPIPSSKSIPIEFQPSLEEAHRAWIRLFLPLLHYDQVELVDGFCPFQEVVCVELKQSHASQKRSEHRGPAMAPVGDVWRLNLSNYLQCVSATPYLLYTETRTKRNKQTTYLLPCLDIVRIWSIGDMWAETIALGISDQNMFTSSRNAFVFVSLQNHPPYHPFSVNIKKRCQSFQLVPCEESFLEPGKEDEEDTDEEKRMKWTASLSIVTAASGNFLVASSKGKDSENILVSQDPVVMSLSQCRVPIYSSTSSYMHTGKSVERRLHRHHQKRMATPFFMCLLIQHVLSIPHTDRDGIHVIPRLSSLGHDPGFIRPRKGYVGNLVKAAGKISAVSQPEPKLSPVPGTEKSLLRCSDIPPAVSHHGTRGAHSKRLSIVANSADRCLVIHPPKDNQKNMGASQMLMSAGLYKTRKYISTKGKKRRCVVVRERTIM
ncbi:hypothetical protein ACRALDRAFT_209469 [Sodiomyces alcalophilus JCM 7366]|uniref:uncharacterized protein n=1 Tax=Sodiomyces alcalophilus JCM 7366 TaxID=591952 RepID=UPI0039B6E3BC